MPVIKVKGVNIRSIKVGEADKIITVFTCERGKISCLAKGARRPKSKFGGRLEVFSYNNYLLATGKSLYITSQVETIESFYGLREGHEILEAASFTAKLVNASSETEQKNPALFALLLETLTLLKDGADPESIKTVFQIKLIGVEGFFPHLDGCVNCRRGIGKEPENVRFNLSLSGLICTACSKKMLGGVVVPYRLIKLMSRIKAGEPKELKDLTIEPDDINKLEMILRPYISEHIGKDMRNW
jgi:DNA repair protein RecO (recombination protein O)